jgi:kynureninase
MKVLPDFRAPDNIRLGVNPLYNSLTELETAVARLRAVVADKLYAQYPLEQTAVT